MFGEYEIKNGKNVINEGIKLSLPEKLNLEVILERDYRFKQTDINKFLQSLKTKPLEDPIYKMSGILPVSLESFGAELSVCNPSSKCAIFSIIETYTGSGNLNYPEILHLIPDFTKWSEKDKDLALELIQSNFASESIVHMLKVQTDFTEVIYNLLHDDDIFYQFELPSNISSSNVSISQNSFIGKFRYERGI